MSKHWTAPSPALMISLIALFVALGSGAYAASKIRTKDIKDEAHRGADAEPLRGELGQYGREGEAEHLHRGGHDVARALDVDRRELVWRSCLHEPRRVDDGVDAFDGVRGHHVAGHHLTGVSIGFFHAHFHSHRHLRKRITFYLFTGSRHIVI